MSVLPEATAGHQPTDAPLSKPASRQRKQGLAVLLLLFGLSAIWLPHRLGGKQEPVTADFTAFYAAGYLARVGQAHQLYAGETFAQTQAALLPHLLEERGYYNPPLFALLISPLSRLPYPAAAALWTAFLLLFLFLSAHLLGCRRIEEPALLAVGFLPFWGALFEGQNSPLVVAVWSLTYVLWARGEAFLAGLATSLLFFKFHLGTGLVLMVLLPPCSVRRAGLGVFCGGSAVVALHGLLMPSSTRAFIDWLSWATSKSGVPIDMPAVTSAGRAPRPAALRDVAVAAAKGFALRQRDSHELEAVRTSRLFLGRCWMRSADGAV